MDKCYLCGGEVTVTKDKPYRYTESGLPVIIHGIPQYTCRQCGEQYVSIPDPEGLHRMIAMDICRNRKAILKKEEIRFLRKNMRLKAKDLARLIGVSASSVSRWENGKQNISEAHDRMLRLFYIAFHREIEQQDKGEGILDMFKGIPEKRKKIEETRKIELNPQEWMGNGCECCPA